MQVPRDENRIAGLLGISSSDGTTPVAIYADPTTHRLYCDVTSASLLGNKSNNSVVPGSTNSGTLPAVATVASPSYTEGYQVALSTDLTGALRVTGSLSVGGTTDNSAFTAGSSTGTPAMGFYHSTIDTVTDGRSAAVAITSKRAMMVNLQTSSGAETGIAALPLQVSLANTGANATAVKVDGSAVTQPVSGTVSITANSAVNVAQINGVTPLMGNGATGTGSQRVTIASDNTVLPGVGAGATGSAVPANAVYTGLIATTANPSSATAGNTVGAMGDKLGRQVVVLGNVRDLKGNQITTITASTSETTVVTAVASTYLDVYGCIVENTSATATKVTFKDSTAGTTQFEIYVPAGDTRGFMLPSSDGFKQTNTNNNWTATCGASVSSIVITMLYVKNT